jgi:hypothetical protein
MMNGIPVYVRVEGTPSHPDDEGVADIYLVEVDASLDPNLRASAALDCFHEHIGIASLDDFSIQTFDAEGRELEEPDGQESYELGDRATFHGAADPVGFTVQP